MIFHLFHGLGWTETSIWKITRLKNTLNHSIVGDWEREMVKKTEPSTQYVLFVVHIKIWYFVFRFTLHSENCESYSSRENEFDV